MQCGLNMRHSYSMFNVFIWCKMQYACNAIQHSCFLHSQSISVFCFQISSFNVWHSCLSMQCWYSVCMLRCIVQYACYTIQYSSLDIKLHAWVTWPWDGRQLDKVCGLKIIARGVPVVPHVPGETVMADSGTSGKASANNAKATLCCVVKQLLTLANAGMLVGKFEFNSYGRLMWTLLDLHKTPKRYHLKQNRLDH